MSSKESSDNPQDLSREDEPFLGEEKKIPRRASWRSPSWSTSTIICLLILSSALIAQNIWLRRRASFGGSGGFKTDMSAAKTTSKLVETRFTGGISINSEGRLYREVDPSQPQYAGRPSPEIDRAWDELLIPVDMVIPASEAHGEERTSFQTPAGYFLTLDVFHSLHCLNLIRKAIDPRYYYPTGEVPYFYRAHLDHCLDYIRQGIQCQSDLTPLTYSFYEPKNTTIPNFGSTHTCRDFSKIYAWAMSRSLQTSSKSGNH